MTRREHEALEIVADVIVERGGQLPLGTLLVGFELVPELDVLALEQLAAAQGVDAAVLRRGHEPGARLSRTPDSRHRPHPAARASRARPPALPTAPAPPVS